MKGPAELIERMATADIIMAITYSDMEPDAKKALIVFLFTGAERGFFPKLVPVTDKPAAKASQSRTAAQGDKTNPDPPGKNQASLNMKGKRGAAAVHALRLGETQIFVCAQDVVDYTGCTQAAASNALGKLAKEGHMRRIRPGAYSLL